MRYDLRMAIEYEYGGRSDHARTLVRVVPSDHPTSQRILEATLDVEPKPHERHNTRDFFGNRMTSLVFHEPIERIAVTLHARAERFSLPAGLDLSPGLKSLAREIAAHPGLDARSPQHFLGPSTRVGTDPAISAFAAALVLPSMTALQVVRALGQALHDEMQFDADATDVDTDAAEAFAARHGVCQDFSHIMIAALRALGVPAAYVSGFLRTIPPEGQARLEGADAMHAWVAAWCGSETGWVEYDPTNACDVRRDHISVAYGRDYADVSPVKGALRSLGPQATHHSVDVMPIAEQQR